MANLLPVVNQYIATRINQLRSAGGPDTDAIKELLLTQTIISSIEALAPAEAGVSVITATGPGVLVPTVSVPFVQVPDVTLTTPAVLTSNSSSETPHTISMQYPVSPLNDLSDALL
jgi:hypothetical protein